MQIDEEEIKINVSIPKKKSNLIAKATVTIKTSIFGYVTIKGFLIWQSEYIHPDFQEKLNITPPNQRIFSKYIPLVFFEDKQSWKLVESKIYDAYHSLSFNKNKEDINPEDIPF